MFGDPYISPKYARVPFLNCMEFNPGKSQIKSVPDDTLVSFVPMECVSIDGSIDVSQTKLLGEVRKGYTYFCDDDVVFAKITPCFENGKVAIAKGCTNGIGFGTTEFHVARSIPGLSNPVWLNYLLKSDSLRHLASSNMSGTAGQKRVQRPFFEKLKIGLPPIEQQNEFAEFVKQVDKSKLKFHKLMESYDTLIKSRFIEEFGNIQTNSKGWKANKLGSLATFKTGGTPSSKHPEYYEGTIPFISTPVLGPNYIDGTSAKYKITEAAIDSCATTLIPAGSLIVGTRINVGKSSINTVDLCTNQDIVSLMDVSRKYELLFLKHCIDQYIPYLDSQKKGATIKGITTELLKSISIPEPPIEQQKSYVDFVKQVDKSKFILTAHFTFLVIIWMKHRLIYYKPNTLHIRIICLSHSIAAFKWRIPLSLRHVKL